MFYQADLDEPPHVHVGKGGKEAKYWITPIQPARLGRFRDHELPEIERIISAHLKDLLAAWQEALRKRGHS